MDTRLELNDDAKTTPLSSEHSPPSNHTFALLDIDWNMGDTSRQNEERGGEYSEEGRYGGMQDMDVDGDEGVDGGLDEGEQRGTGGMQDVDADGDEEEDGGVDDEAQRSTRGKQDVDADGDEEEDGGVDEEQQKSNHAEVSPKASDQSSRTSARLGDRKPETPSSFSLPQAPSKRQRRPGTKREKDMPDLEQENETVLRRLLATGNNYRSPIDVEALDMLMRNFPITEEHQVRFVRVDSSKLRITIIWENRYSRRKFPYQVQVNMYVNYVLLDICKNVIFTPRISPYT